MNALSTRTDQRLHSQDRNTWAVSASKHCRKDLGHQHDTFARGQTHCVCIMRQMILCTIRADQDASLLHLISHPGCLLGGGLQ